MSSPLSPCLSSWLGWMLKDLWGFSRFPLVHSNETKTWRGDEKDAKFRYCCEESASVLILILLVMLLQTFVGIFLDSYTLPLLMLHLFTSCFLFFLLCVFGFGPQTPTTGAIQRKTTLLLRLFFPSYNSHNLNCCCCNVPETHALI